MVLDIQKHAFKESSNKGRWVELSEGGEVLVARWNNPEFRKLQTKLYQDYRNPRANGPRIKGNKIPPQVQEEITQKLVEKTILMDWRGFSSGTEEFAFTPENKKLILTDERFRWIFDEIVAAAMDEEAYRNEGIEEDLGNSEAA